MGDFLENHRQKCLKQNDVYTPKTNMDPKNHGFLIGISFSSGLFSGAMLPSRELTYPTLGKGKYSSKCHFGGIC